LESEQTTYIKTPIGIAKICGTSKGVSSISVSDKGEISNQIPTCLEACVQQLEAYFNGNRKQFDVKLNPKGTEFQIKFKEVKYKERV